MNLPKNWRYIELGDIFEFKIKSKNKASAGKESGNYKFYTSSPVQNKYINDCDFEGEHLIFGTGGNASIHHCNNKFSTSTDCFVVNITDKSIITKYVFYFLKGNIHLLESGFKGAGLKHISKRYLQKIRIATPNDENIQKKIVAILDNAEKLNGWRREADELTDELLKSTFLEMFGDPVKNPKGWDIKKLKDISEKFSDGPFGSNLKTEHYRNNGIRVIRLQNIGVNKFLDEGKAYVSEKHYSNLKKHSCVPGDIIIGTMGSPNLRACILPKLIELAINKADCIQCRPNKSLATSEYLCQLLNLPSTLIIASNMIHGQTRSRLSMGNLSTLSIPIPPLELQKQFSNVVQQIEELQEYQFQTNQHITDLFRSLMQQAFKGELTC